MKVSLNTIKQYTDIDLSLDELVAKINSQLGAIEEITDLSDVYKDAIIVKVVKCVKHPNADKLNVCWVDDDGVREDVERNEDGLVQVVCGAPNVHADMYAVWLPPRAVVPATYHEAEPFVLGARELRGVVSQGMLAAGDELALNNDHDGILILDPDEWKPGEIAIKPGESFAKAYGLDDTIIDIENKMFTHRPDLFGQLGVAREIAGIQHKKFTSPEWYLSAPEFSEASGLELEVFNEAGENVPRFMAVAMKDVTVKPSPLWLQCALVAMGGKPINNIVDVTNYVMLLTAQPTHAYDYDKIRGHTLGARMAKQGEKAELLNGKTYELTEDDIVIVDAEGVVGLGGIMGGGNSEVSPETKNIVLEVGNFDMYTVRKSAMRHGVFTDALTRFNKGQSPLQNVYVLQLLMMSLRDVSPESEQASAVFDEFVDNRESEPVVVSHDFIKNRLQPMRISLNDPLSEDAINQLLENVEFRVEVIEDGVKRLKLDLGTHSARQTEEINDIFSIKVPFWRTDIELPEDIVEEVGRLYGFDKLPRELPKRSTKPAAKNAGRELAKRVRENLARSGANEVLTYSFMHKKVIERAGQDAENAYRISNALSPDLQYYRLSLTPSLLDKIHPNVKAGYGEFALFEQNKVHYKGEMDASEPTVPNEDSHIALVVTRSKDVSGSPYYAARKYLEQIVDIDKLELQSLSDFDLTKDAWGKQLTAPYEPKRSAVIVKDGQIWGVLGEFTQSTKRGFKLPASIAGFEIHRDIATEAGKMSVYKPLSRYPSTSRDISFKVVEEVTYGQLVKLVDGALADVKEVNAVVTPVTIYQAEVETTRTITISITLTSYDRTLSAEEANEIIDKITKVVIAATGAEVI